MVVGMKLPAFLLLFCFLIGAADSPQSVFDRAVGDLAAGRYAAAEAGFEQVLRSDPNNIGALGNLGVVYSRTNQIGKAIAVYERALKLSPHDPQLELNLGLAYLKQDNHAAARPHFERVLAAHEDNLQARKLVATCRLYMGEVPSAIKDLEVLRAQDPNNTGVLYLLGVGYIKDKQRVKARAILDEMFSSAASPAQASFILGKTYYDASEFSEAELLFIKARELDPNFPGLSLELAKTYLSERRNEEAVAQLRAILKEKPDDADANYFLGGALVQDGKYGEGISYLEKTRQLTPDAWGVFFYLGKAHLQLGQAALAATLLQHSIELNPLEASAFYQLARARRTLGQKRAAQAALKRVKELRSRGLKREVGALEASDDY
jgi:tetratricopeptide (TPR) repeat protein